MCVPPFALFSFQEDPRLQRDRPKKLLEDADKAFHAILFQGTNEDASIVCNTCSSLFFPWHPTCQPRSQCHVTSRIGQGVDLSMHMTLTSTDAATFCFASPWSCSVSCFFLPSPSRVFLTFFFF